MVRVLRVDGDDEAFAAFVGEVEPRLRRALTARRGVEVGRDATAEALAWAWTDWPRVREVVAVAAAGVVLLAALGGLVRSGLDDDTVTTGPSTTAALPHDLDELADRVAVLPTTVLSGTDDARDTYRRAISTIESPTIEASSSVEDRWVGRDGSGRIIHTEGDAVTPNESSRGPGALSLGPFTPGVALALTDDVEAVAAAIDAAYGAGSFGPRRSAELVDVLTYAGLPGPARAGVLRALDRIGFVLVPGADVGPDLVRAEGPSRYGVMQADLDVRTGEVVALTRPVEAQAGSAS